MVVKVVNNKEVYVHIGLHKTGTTFLQNEIFPKMNVNYIYKWKDEHRIKKDKNLISNENLSGNPFEQYTDKRNVLLRGIKATYPHGKIILGLRNKKEIIASLYSQWILGGGTESFDFFYTKMVDNPHLDYQKLYRFLRMLFGENNIFIYQYEQLVQHPDEIIERLCDFINVPVPDYMNKRYRKRLDQRKIWLLRFLNKFFEYSYKDNSGRRGMYSNRNLIGKL